jgi:hypothetical protein
VVVRVGQGVAHLYLVSTDCTEDQQPDNEQENPDHPGPEPKADFEQRYAEKH